MRHSLDKYSSANPWAFLSLVLFLPLYVSVAFYLPSAQGAESETPLAAEPSEPAISPSPEETLAQLLEASPHLDVIERTDSAVTDHVIGLGAMKKVRGVWGLKKSERISGTLQSVTWRVLDGFSATEVLAEIIDAYQLGAIEKDADAAQEEDVLLFGCDGRACGHGAQWARRVFGQRLLYGRGDAQQYRAYSLGADEYRLVLYGAVRSSDRQYVHLELLKR